METPQIRSIAKLQEYLHAAIKLEHATIPPYLTALYSIHPQTNSDAFHTIRVVAVEEMLHLTLAANILNAVGGTPDLTAPDFVGPYPGFLPDGETDFEVGLQRFCPESIETFLKIERPREAKTKEARFVRTDRAGPAALLQMTPGEGMRYFSIGEFYSEIQRGLVYLQEQGEDLFVGDHRRQITPEYYYSGGGHVIVVTDMESARAAIRLIAEQSRARDWAEGSTTRNTRSPTSTDSTNFCIGATTRRATRRMSRRAARNSRSTGRRSTRSRRTPALRTTRWNPSSTTRFRSSTARSRVPGPPDTRLHRPARAPTHRREGDVPPARQGHAADAQPDPRDRAERRPHL
jgi:hypothetical protein